MNKDSNKYIFLYSVGLVAVSAALLSLAAVWLAPYQHRNVETEKKQNILQTVRKADSADLVPDKDAYIEANYGRYITQSKVVNAQGIEVEGNAFEIDLSSELAKPASERLLPVFVCADSVSVQYILPLRGTGLWGPIWGYIALQSDMNTICGAVFDHKSETPGLGAEIAAQKFQEQFIGKQIFEGDKFISIEVKKSGNVPTPHSVDAVSGGTITSEGLHNMLAQGLGWYVPFLKAEQKKYTQSQKPKPSPEAAPAPPKPAYAARPQPPVSAPPAPDTPKQDAAPAPAADPAPNEPASTEPLNN